MAKTIVLDLGTTNSYVAVMEGHKASIETRTRGKALSEASAKMAERALFPARNTAR